MYFAVSEIDFVVSETDFTASEIDFAVVKLILPRRNWFCCG